MGQMAERAEPWATSISGKSEEQGAWQGIQDQDPYDK